MALAVVLKEEPDWRRRLMASSQTCVREKREEISEDNVIVISKLGTDMLGGHLQEELQPGVAGLRQQVPAQRLNQTTQRKLEAPKRRCKSTVTLTCKTRRSMASIMVVL